MPNWVAAKIPAPTANATKPQRVGLALSDEDETVMTAHPPGFGAATRLALRQAKPYTFSLRIAPRICRSSLESSGMRAHHDLGGLGEGSVDPSPHQPSLFDKRVDALMMLLVAPPNRFFTVDAQRRAQESLPADEYKNLEYYARWIRAIATLLVETDRLSQGKIDARVAVVRERFSADHENGRALEVPQHDHDHAPIQDEHRLPHEHEILEEAIRELCIERGFVTASEIQQQIDQMDSRTPSQGSALVARAWSDAAFHQAVMADAKAAAESMGIDLTGSPAIQAVQNTPEVHHMVVCTLCSCYPRMLLGVPPSWYKSRAYRARAVSEPRAVLAEFGTVFPDTVEIRVVDSTADLRYLVLPLRPAGTDGWSADNLARLVTRDSMIGVAPARHRASLTT